MNVRRFFLCSLRGAILIAALALCSMAPVIALAATWSSSTHIAKPGDRVEVELRFRGDGGVVATDATWVLDSARLSVDAPSDARFDVLGTGICATNGWSRVSAIYFSPDNSPLPEHDQLICAIPIRVSDSAEPGLAHIRLASSHCADTGGGEKPCEVAEGWVDVRGTDASPSPEWVVDDTLDLVVRLREGDAAEALRDVADGRTNVEGAEQDLRELLDRFRLVPDNSPDRVRRLQSRPPTLDEATWYRQHTDWASAQLHRTLVVGFNDQPRRDKALAALEAHESVESVSIRRIDVLRYPPSSTRTTAAKGHLSNPSPFVPKDQSMASNERGKSTGNTVPQEHLNQLRIGQAWKIAEGWGLVGTADSGIYRNHSELKSFAGAASIGGNFIPGATIYPPCPRMLLVTDKTRVT